MTVSFNGDVIRNVKIHSQTTGTDQTAAGLDKVTAAQKRAAESGETLSTTTETSSRRQLTAAGAYENLLRRVDEVHRAQVRYNKDAAIADKAVGQGIINAEQYSRTLQLIADKYGIVTSATAKLRAEQEAQATALARQNAEAQKASALNARVNAVTGVSGLSDGAKRSEDITAYGRQLDDLRAKYSPLYAAGRQYKETLNEINMAARVGAISEKERAAAIMDTKVAFVQQTNTLRGVNDAFQTTGSGVSVMTKQLGLARHEMINLSRQGQDVVTMLAMGAPVTQVITSQAAQVIDIFSSSQGTLRGFFGQVTSGLTSMITPARLAFGGIVTGAGAATFAVYQYLDAQKQVQMSVLGIGRATGATQGSINAVAKARSSTFGLSVSEAREMASALVATGRVANDNLLPIVKIGKDIANVFGVEATEATKMLAQAMSDPVRGADSLNARLGFLDAGMRRNIENLVAQNRQWEAQKVLIDAVRSGLVGVDAATGPILRGWTAVSNAVSNVWGDIGRVVAQQLRLENLDTTGKVEEATRSLERLRAIRDDLDRRGRSTAGVDQAIARETIEREKLTRALEGQATASARAFAAQQTFAQEAAIRNLLPEISQRERLNNEFETLQRLMNSLSSDERAGEQLRMLGLGFDQVARALQRANTQLRDFETENERAAINAKIALDATTAFSPGARADIARRQAMESNRGNPEAAARAEEAYRISLQQSNVALSEQRRERALTANQALESANLENQIAGRSIAAQNEARMNLQTRQQLEQEAARNRTAVDEAEYQRLIKINAEIAKKSQGRALSDATSNAMFQRDVLFMSPADQQVAQTMRGIYDNEWQAHMDDALAKQMRMNALLIDFNSTGQEAFRGLLTDFRSQLAQGTSAWESFQKAGANALNRIADKLMQMAADNLWMSAFGGSGGGLGSLLGGLFGGGSGGGAVTMFGGAGANFPVPTFGAERGGTFGHGWGIVGEAGPELINVRSSGVTVYPNAQSGKMLGLPGFASGGSLDSVGRVIRPASDNRGGGASVRVDASDNRVITITGGDQAAVAELKALLAKDKQNRKAEIIMAVREAQNTRNL